MFKKYNLYDVQWNDNVSAFRNLTDTVRINNKHSPRYWTAKNRNTLTETLVKKTTYVRASVFDVYNSVFDGNREQNLRKATQVRLFVTRKTKKIVNKRRGK